MKKPRGHYQGTERRRRAILDAALACFAEAGYVNTTLEDIRRRSGASNGSIYHHFKGKEQLAAAVYLQGIFDYQAALLAEFAAHCGARDGIRAIISHHLTWVANHTTWARYLVHMRHADFMGHAEGAIADANREFAGELTRFIRHHVGRGTLRRLSPAAYLALLLGPCQELARHRLLAGRELELESAIDELAEAAWQALRARRADGRRSRPGARRPTPATRPR